MVKFCKDCNISLTKTNWPEYRQNNNFYVCNSCVKTRHRFWYKKNIVRIRRLCRNYYSKNKNRILVKNEQWRRRNLQKWSKMTSENHQRLRLDTMKHYSPNLVCQKCGFGDIRALSFDHIKGGGNKQSKNTGRGSYNLCRWLKKKDYPKGYQILCMNCNFIKAHENMEYCHKYLGVKKEETKDSK